MGMQKSGALQGDRPRANTSCDASTDTGTCVRLDTRSSASPTESHARAYTCADTTSDARAYAVANTGADTTTRDSRAQSSLTRHKSLRPFPAMPVSLVSPDMAAYRRPDAS